MLSSESFFFVGKANTSTLIYPCVSSWNFHESNTEITSSRIDYKIVARFEDLNQNLAVSIPTKTNVLNEAQVQQDILKRGKHQ